MDEATKEKENRKQGEKKRDGTGCKEVGDVGLLSLELRRKESPAHHDFPTFQPSSIATSHNMPSPQRVLRCHLAFYFLACPPLLSCSLTSRDACRGLDSI